MRTCRTVLGEVGMTPDAPVSNMKMRSKKHSRLYLESEATLNKHRSSFTQLEFHWPES